MVSTYTAFFYQIPLHCEREPPNCMLPAHPYRYCLRDEMGMQGMYVPTHLLRYDRYFSTHLTMDLTHHIYSPRLSTFTAPFYWSIPPPSATKNTHVTDGRTHLISSVAVLGAPRLDDTYGVCWTASKIRGTTPMEYRDCKQAARQSDSAQSGLGGALPPACSHGSMPTCPVVGHVGVEGVF